jgi:hypothetical protein
VRAWHEIFEEHFKENLGGPRAHLRDADAEIEVFIFDVAEARSLLVSFRIGQRREDDGSGRDQAFVMLVPAAHAMEAAYVFVNAVCDLRRAGIASPGRLIPLRRRVSPEFVRKWRKTALLVRAVLDERLPAGLATVRNGSRFGTVRQLVPLTAAERGYSDSEGSERLEAALLEAEADLSSLDRESVVDEEFAREPHPARWSPTLVVPRDQEARVSQLGAYRVSGASWAVPSDLDPFLFDRWLSRQSRWELGARGPVQLLPAAQVDSWNGLAAGQAITQAPEQEPSCVTFHFRDKMGARFVHETDIRVLRDSTVCFNGKYFAVTGSTSKRVDCEEVPPPFFQASRSEFSDELHDFLSRRGSPVATMDEEALKGAVLGILSQWFTVELEVWGRHPSGTKIRIDAVLRPKDREPWRSKDVAIGLEFKSPGSAKSHASRDSAVMAQTLDYAMCDFEGYGQILVFICPAPAQLRGEMVLFRFLAQYGVGYVELETIRGVTLYLGDQSRILWSELKGVSHLGRTTDLSRKVGNRGRR